MVKPLGDIIIELDKSPVPPDTEQRTSPGSSENSWAGQRLFLLT